MLADLVRGISKCRGTHQIEIHFGPCEAGVEVSVRGSVLVGPGEFVTIETVQTVVYDEAATGRGKRRSRDSRPNLV